MSIPARLQLLEGLWQGVSELNFSEDPAVENIFESPSALEVALDSTGAFATVSYTWRHDGSEQHGQFLIAGSETSDAVSAGWSDSWHQGGGVMSLEGSGMGEDDELSLTGSYSTEAYGTWGWRIELDGDEDALDMLMTNISPDGEEGWSVRASYARA